ncbi:MAG: phenylalanine--tRNA ligase subunit alpha, partial [Flavobacteriales bacterium]
MLEKVEQLVEKVKGFTPKSEEELNNFRIEYLGKKGFLNNLFASFREVPNEQKKDFGATINKLKQLVQDKIEEHKSSFEIETQSSEIDLTKNIPSDNLGSRHPISLIRNEIVEIFNRIGFTVSEGPEIEDDWHNFSALNLPEEHPARDMQDTFFIQTNPDVLLRTHTSSVQVRYMEGNQPPIRTLSPGRVYRNEAISARAHCFFHQIEGLYIDKDVSFADMKKTLLYFTKSMFGNDAKIRLRPSYFPFTEPSAEVDVSCTICNEKGCNVCKYSGWLEIMGCGMVDPNVLENCNIDSEIYSGYAFGMGVERIAQLIYQVNDLRLYSEND